MNTIIEAIKQRRSIRSYEARPIPRDLLNAVIEAGNEAPSAMNSQPWRFVVVENGEAKKKLLGAALPRAKANNTSSNTLTLFIIELHSTSGELTFPCGGEFSFRCNIGV